MSLHFIIFQIVRNNFSMLIGAQFSWCSICDLIKNAFKMKMFYKLLF